MTSSSPPPSQFIFPNDQPVVSLDCQKAFEGLSRQEQLYAHYLSKASWFGGLIVLIQTSPESAPIFRLIHRLNSAESTESLKKAALAAGVSEDDFAAYTVFCSGVYTNMGNYKGFGDSKIVPNITADAFEKIVKASAAHGKDSAAMEELWGSVKTPMYALSERERQLGLGEKGVTTYFSANCDQGDSDKINRYFKLRNLEGYINRALKTVDGNGKNVYEIRNAAVNRAVLSEEEFEDASFRVTTGDYSPLLALVNENLKKAAEFAGRDEEKAMLLGYVKSFEEGSLAAHKDGSRHWIRNKGPAVETYIGFIETYRDPIGMRGEFEGFVSMVNKEQSAKFQELVNNAEQILTRLPWPKEFEKDKFLLPDFTSLDVLTFAGSGVPAGINIPNYDEIRQSEGFKNVNLGNVVSSSYKADDKKITFCSDEDHLVLKKWRVPSFEVQVGLHELLGHGSGKLLRKEEDGKFNFDAGLINPLTGKPVEKFYEKGETYDSVFTSMGSSYEECRAEAVGLYLSCFKDIVKIFGLEGDFDDVLYANWLSLVHSGVKGVEMYAPATKEWKQAHCQARFVLVRVMIEAGEGFLDVKETVGEDGKPDLLISMDRNKVESVGKPAVGDFLRKLQVYKSTGDLSEAAEMYNRLSAVEETGQHPFAKWRDIILARKTPRKMLVQSNTAVKDEKLEFTPYEANHEGMIKSWTERFTDEETAKIDQILAALHKADQPYFA